MHLLPRLLFSACLMTLAVSAAAQADTAPTPDMAREATRTDSLAAIDRDVWQPFLHGINHFDDAAYMQTRATDYVMVEARGKGQFLDRDFYAEDSAKVMRDLKQSGQRLEASVRFEQRLADGEHGFDRGVMRIVLHGADGSARPMYSRFDIVHRREAGHWRVLTEYRGPSNEQAWVAAAPAG